MSAVNPTCPVDKLPPEVLTRCFLYLTPYFPLTVGPGESTHDWIRVAHVCKRWRAVAFSFSGLWDRVEFTRPEILEMYLTLSRSLPLEVCLYHVGRRFRQLVEPYDEKMMMLDPLVFVRTRMRSLIIHKDWIPPPHHLCRFIEEALPELETLSITSDVGWESGSECGSKRRLRALFKHGLPRLRELFIPEYTPWPHNDFKDLTFLCLYNQSALEEELPNLLHMLRGSPNLEELYVRQHEYSPWIDDPPSNLGPAFPAHSLRRLHLFNFSNQAIVCILSTMLLQPNGVAIRISDTEMAPDTFARILPLLPPGSTLRNTEQLEVYHNSGGPFGIMFCGTGCSLRIGGCLSTYGEEDREAAIALFGYIYRECAQTLKELWIHHYQNFRGVWEGYVVDNLSCFNLEKLVLVLTGGEGISDRLCVVLDPGNPEVQDLPAPRLRSLTIRGVHKQPQLERLVALCEGRSKTDHPLREASVACGPGDVQEWMTRLCSSSPTPIYIDTRDEWDGQMMELPIVCTDDTDPWWESWEEAVVEYDS